MPMTCGGFFYVHQGMPPVNPVISSLWVPGISPLYNRRMHPPAQSKAMGAPNNRQKCNTGPRYCQGIKTADTRGIQFPMPPYSFLTVHHPIHQQKPLSKLTTGLVPPLFQSSVPRHRHMSYGFDTPGPYHECMFAQT